ncbi:MAG: hypothetical protein V4469_00730 [Patescibacteria group bacterium]
MFKGPEELNPYQAPKYNQEQRLPVESIETVRSRLAEIQTIAGELTRVELLKRIEDTLKDCGREDIAILGPLGFVVFAAYHGLKKDGNLTMEFVSKEDAKKPIKIVFAAHADGRYMGRVIE